MADSDAYPATLDATPSDATGTARFRYDPAVHAGATARRKRDAIEQIDENIDGLFDRRGAEERFCRILRRYRAKLAGSLAIRSGRALTAREERRFAQRLLVRLSFLYSSWSEGS